MLSSIAPRPGPLISRRPFGLTAALLLVLVITGMYLAGLFSGQIPRLSVIGSESIAVEADPAESEAARVFAQFAAIRDVDKRKQQFLDYLEDHVVARNQAIASQRGELLALLDIMHDGFALSPHERQWLLALAKTYQVDVSTDQEIADELLLRVDGIPVSLVLAQAANESAWGTSRFALEGNNIFGEWCFTPGCGIIPLRRPLDAIHQVQRFDSVAASIESYFLNINTHDSYHYLRQLRAHMRQQGLALDPLQLALGLGSYSQRGYHYVDEVQNIILQNNLAMRDRGGVDWQQ